MPLTLRHNTQQQNLPSALSHGVGLPVSDGGLGAASRALSQVAGAAGDLGARLQRREQQVKQKDVSSAYNAWALEVQRLEGEANLALEKNDAEAFNAARTSLQELNPESSGFLPNAFLPAQAKTVTFKDSDWDPFLEQAKPSFLAIDQKLYSNSIRKRYVMQYTEDMDNLRGFVSEAIRYNSVDAINFEELALRASIVSDNFEADGDLSESSRKKGVDELFQIADSFVTAHIYSPEKYPTISSYNEELDRMIQSASLEGRFVGRQADLIKRLEAKKLSAGSLDMPDNLYQSIKTDTTTAFETALGPLDASSSNLYATIKEWEQSPGVSKSTRNFLSSAATSIDVRDTVDANMPYIFSRLAADSKLRPEDILLEDNRFKTLRPEHQSSLERMLRHRYKTYFETASVQAVPEIHPEKFGGRQIDRVAMARATTPSGEARYQSARTSFLTAVQSFGSEEGQKYASDSANMLSDLVGPDPHGEVFLGLEFAKELWPDAGGREKTAILQTLRSVWGDPSRTNNFIAFFQSAEDDPISKEIATHLSVQNLLTVNPDVEGPTELELGLNEASWVAERTTLGRKNKQLLTYERFKESVEDGDGSIGPIVEALGVADPFTDRALTQVLYGRAMREIQEYGSTPPDVGELVDRVSRFFNDNILIMENPVNGQVRFSTFKQRVGGDPAGPIQSIINELGPLFEPFRSIEPSISRSAKYGDLNAFFYAVDNRNLLQNVITYTDPESALGNRLRDKGIHPMQTLYDMWVNGQIRLSEKTIPINGVEARSIELNIPQDQRNPDLWDQVWGNKRSVGNSWVAARDLQAKDGSNSIIYIADVLTQPTEEQADEIDRRYRKERLNLFINYYGKKLLELATPKYDPIAINLPK